MFVAILFLFLFILTSIELKHFWTKKSLPPGPRFSLPIIGNVFALAGVYLRGKFSQQELFRKWAIQYGKVFSYWFGSRLIVVINDAKLIREAFTTEDIADRPPNDKWFDETNQGTGVIFNSGYVWKHQRKFASGILRNLGSGNPSFEDVIRQEAFELTSAFIAKKETPFCPHILFKQVTCNVVSHLLVGQRFPYEDQEFTAVIKATERNAQIGTGLIFFPFMKYIPGQSKLLDEYDTNLRLTLKFLRDRIDEHKNTFDGENIRDMTDGFLQEMKQLQSAESTSSIFIENNLAPLLMDVFVTGTVTVSTVLSWFLLYMITKPDLQEQIHTEIDMAVGRDRLPTLGDKSSLPFTEAVTLEVMRLQTIIPVLTHYAAKDTYLKGYLIPKGAVVYGNVWHMSHDADIWEDPYDFKPERFLDKDGKCNPRADVMLPFGKGRRLCMGEQISKMELFIFVTHLMHQFSFRLADNAEAVSFEAIDGVNHSPKQYKLVAVPRK